MASVVDSLLLRQMVDGVEDIRRSLRAQTSRLGAIEARFASAEHRWAETEARLDAFSENMLAIARRFDLVAAIASEARDVAIETRGLVHDLDQRLSRAEGKVDALEERLSRVEAKVDALEGRLSRVEGKVDVLEERLSRVEDKVDGLRHDMATLGEGIDHLSQNVTALLRALPRIPGIATPNATQA